jgi:pilus assembly protein Flp/PilA
MINLGIKYLVDSCKSIHRNESGQDLAEYAILASLIAIVVIAAVTLVGTTLGTTFNTITAAIAGVAGGGS